MKRIRTALAKLDATLELSPDSDLGIREYNIYAPPNKVWNCSGTHTLVLNWRIGYAKARAEAMATALTDIRAGISDCPIEHCEECT